MFSQRNDSESHKIFSRALGVFQSIMRAVSPLLGYLSFKVFLDEMCSVVLPVSELESLRVELTGTTLRTTLERFNEDTFAQTPGMATFGCIQRKM